MDDMKTLVHNTFMKNNEVTKTSEENFIENTVNDEELDTMSNNENIEGFSFQGGKKRRKGSSKKRGTRSTKKRVVKRKTTRKKSTKKKKVHQNGLCTLKLSAKKLVKLFQKH